MDKKIVVPEEGLKAANDAVLSAMTHGRYLDEPMRSLSLELHNKIALQAFCRWLSEHPIVPTDKQIDELLALWNDEYGNHVTFGEATKRISAEWQRRMFLAPPEPEAVSENEICEIGAVLRDRGLRISNAEIGSILAASRKQSSEPMKCSVCGVDVSDPLTPSMHYSAAGTVMRGHDDVANQPSKHTPGIPLELCGLEPTTWPTYGGITRGSMEPSVPEEIKDLLWSLFSVIRPEDETLAENDRRIIEAFRRGQKAKL